MPLFLVPLLFAVESPVYQQPQIASNGRDVGIVFGAKNSIYYTHNQNEPVRVADAPVLSLGNHRGPRIAFTAGAIVITVGVGPADQQYGPNTLRSWRSTDAGKTWSAGPDLSMPGTGGMGFQAIASDGKTGLWAAWIGPHDGHPALYAAHSENQGVTWSKQQVLSETVCECCHPTVAVSADGAVHILFRNSLDGNRDPFLATAKDGEHFQFTKLGQGSWPIQACPMDGGGLGEFRGDVISIWRRQGDLFLARPDGRAEERLDAGRNASIALGEAGIYAVWSGAEGLMAKTPGKGPYLLSKTGAFPVIASQGAVIAAWEENGKIRTQRLD
jgi:hypothetical protein